MCLKCHIQTTSCTFAQSDKLSCDIPPVSHFKTLVSVVEPFVPMSHSDLVGQNQNSLQVQRQNDNITPGALGWDNHAVP